MEGPVVLDSKERQQLGLPVGRLWAHGRLLVARAALALAKDLTAGGLKNSDRLTQTSLQDSFQDIADPLQGATMGPVLDDRHLANEVQAPCAMHSAHMAQSVVGVMSQSKGVR